MTTMLDDLPIHTWLTDMDGVLVHEDRPLPGAADFIAALQRFGRPFLVLTNNSIFTPRDLRARLSRSGIDLPEESLWTSAMATARFLAEQKPGAAAYVIGEAGLTSAMHDEGFILADIDVEFVVLGETRTYSFEAITRAIRLVQGGAKFIATNPDVTGPSMDGPMPATGAVAAMITAATGISPYYIGKPNPLMMRTALNRLGAHSETSVMIGDRMDTDVKSGLEAGMRSVLVLSGSTTEEEIAQYPFRPTAVLDGIADVVPLVEQLTPIESVELDED
ncbi:HAD-IIA family hydrolase [Brachybacterium sp. YJGR34]|uniref:HAD-IIA family hydrolase n=1 Tax=Brachybacterium sp. YJGR34 TaxID=2059911 RepID=UPI000E0B0D0D|nr:HAD-IIA family hydrolase [Brachybacterium sp. YJGR34]